MSTSGAIPKEALPESSDFPWMVTATVAINVLALALPLLMLQVFDRVLPYRALDTLALLVIGTATALVAEAALKFMRSSVMVWAAARFEHGAMCDAVSRLLASREEKLERGGYADRFKAIGALKEYFSGQTFLQLLDLPFTILYLALVAVIGGWMVLVPVVGAIAFGWVSIRFGETHGAMFRERSMADRRRSNFLVETLGGIHTVKAMAMEAFMLRRYERLQETCSRLTQRLASSTDLASGIGGLFTPLMTVLVVAAGGYLAVTGQLTNGELAACIMLTLRSLGPIQKAGSIWIALQRVRALHEEIVPLFRHPTLAERPKLRPEESAQVAGRIELREVAYRIPKSASNVLDRVSLAFEPGECVVIKGANGSGRSTLLKLLGGLLQPDSGDVFLDGQPMARLDPAFLRSTIAYVSEDAQLFQGTILENISGFEPRNIDRAMQIALMIGLDKFVAKLPRGWESPVGESAADTTPVGHRQRISMARALATGAKVVLFDAANVSMDSEGEAALLGYLAAAKGKTTLIMVTHRPSLQKIADRTLVIDGGRVEPDTGVREVSAIPALPPAEHTDLGGTGEHTFARPEPPAATREDATRWERIRLAVLHSFAKPGDLARCITELLKALDWRGDPRDVAESLPYFEEMLDLSGLLNCMAQLRYRSSSVELALRDLDERLLPCLFLPEGGSGLVLLRREGHKFSAYDSAADARCEVSDAVLRGTAYFFSPGLDEPATNAGWALRVVARMRPLIAQVMVAAMIYGLVLLPVPLFVMAVYAYVMPSGSIVNLAFFTLGAVIAILVGAIFIVHRSRILAYIAGRIDFLYGTAVFKQILALPPSMSEGAAIGAQMARLSSFESIRDLFTGPIASTLLESPALLAFIIALGILNPAALLVVALTVAFYAVLYLLLSSRVDRHVAELARRTSRRQEFLVETIGKLSAIREFGGEQTWLRRFREVSASASMAGYFVGTVSASLAAGGYLVTMAGGLGVIVVSIIFAADGAFGIGVVIGSTMLAWRIFGPVQTAFANLTRIDRVRNAANQMDRLMSLRGERDWTVSAAASRLFRGRVEFDRVSFRYSLDTDPALIGASFNIEPGKIVAVTGPNGGGKSTLLKLLAGLYSPQAGSVRIDDMDLRQIDPVELRRAIGYAPQDCSLFRGTIAQNLRLVRPTATDPELARALALAGALNDIALLPEGIYTRLGDGATQRFSLSLRQKLSLARAYLTNAPVLLFDEPASTLDAEGDRWFMDAMRNLRGRSTIFLVTHRPSHIRLADIAMVIQAGYVRMIGSPGDALKRLGMPA